MNGTLVFFDLETTGLPEEIGPANVQITELALVAVGAQEFKDCHQGELRAVNKLCLCFQPRAAISLQAAILTGLDNLLLEHHLNFSPRSTELIYSFLQHLEAPIWLVAHNGLRFDFPLLRAELNRTGTSSNRLPPITCIDTMPALKQIMESTPQEPVVTTTPSKLTGDELELLQKELLEIQENYQEIDRATTFKYDEIHKTPPSKRSNITSDSNLPCPPPTNSEAGRARKNLFGTQPPPRVAGYSLGVLYQHFFRGEEFDSHCAEEDCRALMKICHQMKHQFLAWIQTNGQPLDQIEPLW